jgi:hypothetical protein
MRPKAYVITEIKTRSRRPTRSGTSPVVPVRQLDCASDRNAGEEGMRFVNRQHRGLAAPDHMLGPAHRGGGIDGDDMAGEQPVEQHGDSRQVLLDCRLLENLAESLGAGTCRSPASPVRSGIESFYSHDCLSSVGPIQSISSPQRTALLHSASCCHFMRQIAAVLL